MAPARPLKRQKTNPTPESRSESSPQEQAQQAASVPLPPDTPPASSPSTPKQDQRSSWLARTWPRKAPPLTQTHRESVSSASTSSTAAPSSTTTTATEVPLPPKEKIRSQRSPSLAMALGKSTSNRSLPIDATTTLVNATPEAATSSGKKDSQIELPSKTRDAGNASKPAANGQQRPEKTDTSPVQQEVVTEPTPEISQPPANPQQAQESQSMWMSWLGRRDGNAAKPAETQPPPPKPVTESSIPPAVDTDTNSIKSPQQVQEQSNSPAATNNKRSWYQMWSSGDQPGSGPTKQPEPPSEPPQASNVQRVETTGLTKAGTDSLDIPPPKTPKAKEGSQASSLETSPPPQLPGDGSKSAGWVFWSREKKRPASTASAISGTDPHVGEIAISNTPSQARPKRASISLQDDSAKPKVVPSAQEEQSKKTAGKKAPEVKQQPATEEKRIPTAQKKAIPTKEEPLTTKATSSNATATAREPAKAPSTPRPASPVPSKKGHEDPNLLLPHLNDTLTYEEQPSLLQQLARLLYYTKESDQPRQLSLLKEPPRIRNALAIGVHGYFPSPMVRSILGQPTGTSIKFAEKAAKNIRRYTKSQGYDCEVKTAALEGEGRIAERVELLWKLLLNWIDEIRRSDFVMIAAHSQGVPVAMMLVSKLIHFGCLAPTARVGVCAMAGVNMGPFQDYKSPWITGSAGELFEFTDPNSKVSKDYMAAIAECLKFGVKVTFVGSIDDQLVSMESSIFAPLTHPHIYRAVSIDSRIHAPNFLSNLVGFVLKLRNVGVPDHGLIRELSTPLAGSLYTGEGHSRLYEDDAVYRLAIAFALETTSTKDVAISSSKRQALPTSSTSASASGSGSGSGSSISGTNTTNPYILPFAMRGILEEDIVKKELRDEARQLLEQFDEWEPKTKVLKDVKFRLEGIRSQLY
ncbi:uncharacterized protein Z520_00678 [Fonsecaea multimorphosa CBS 102226]|uniref:YMC020W-like alpha/beta hydrolase domain-containing protein n=1 Tax=Fonsecaea multimorphosa CBS 102226 TaxID=1442371 RepID=A0A0D2HQ31_9EURO|nr:uncharacterized protein Z520_00678 [Fonsecaea multimorphosa CBS 102226]KIY03986.1 hypothetical protein Z520_00678 [Fonsecaea multimorphosa CBS 102226]OAL31825.1 hypothetical protein AYO22_00695 [Fonsecaea multimorphosa]